MAKKKDSSSTTQAPAAPSNPFLADPEFNKFLDDKVGKTVSKRLKSKMDLVSAITETPSPQKATEQAADLSAFRNSNTTYHHIPNIGIRAGNSQQYISSLIASLNTGVFYQISLFVDALMEDETVWGNLFVRLQSLISSRIDIIPADESEEAIKIRDCAQKYFPYMITNSQISELMRWGLMNGAGFANVYMDECDGYQIPKIDIWHPRFARYDWGFREYKMVTENMGEVFMLHEDPQWMIVEPFGDFYPWLRGLIKPLANIQIKRHWALEWWAKFEEVAGAPMFGAVVPPNTDPEHEEMFVRAIEEREFAPVVRLPQGDNGNRYELEVIQAKADLYTGFEAMLKYCDSKIAVLILGQDFSTGGSPGFFSSENPGKAIRQEIRRHDARCIEHVIYEKLLKPWAEANFGDAALAPQIRFDIEDKEDQLKKTQAFQTLIDGMNKAGFAQIPLDVKAILNDFDIPIADIAAPVISQPLDAVFRNPDSDQEEMQNAVLPNHEDAGKGVGEDTEATDAEIQKLNSYSELKAYILRNK